MWKTQTRASEPTIGAAGDHRLMSEPTLAEDHPVTHELVHNATRFGDTITSKKLADTHNHLTV